MENLEPRPASDESTPTPEPARLPYQPPRVEAVELSREAAESLT